jgi:hypothetical protein
MNKIDLVLQQLHQMGFETNVIEKIGHVFHYEDLSVLYMPNEDDEDFLQLAIPQVFDVTDENREEVSNIIERINLMLKYVKLGIVDRESVWIYYEHKLFGSEDMEMVLEHIIRTLHFTYHILNNEIDGEDEDIPESEEEDSKKNNEEPTDNDNQKEE